jgi:hypothetical protein
LYKDYPAVLIESKYSEPFGREHTGLSGKYLQVPGLWSDLPTLRDLAGQVSGDIDPCFTYLHAAQLIKHVLAGVRSFGKAGFTLFYFYYDAFGPAGIEHNREIDFFKFYLQVDGVAFRALSHQEYLLRLAKNERPNHPAYIDWLVERYL